MDITKVLQIFRTQICVGLKIGANVFYLPYAPDYFILLFTVSYRARHSAIMFELDFSHLFHRLYYIIINVITFFSALVVLLNHDPVVDCRDDLGRTPLHLAAASGHKQCVKALLMNGATPHVRDNQTKYV